MVRDANPFSDSGQETLVLNRFLAQSGVASRRKAVDLIRAGHVRVNGAVVTHPATRVSSEDRVEVRGKRVRITQDYRYILLNKPADVLTTVEDDRQRRTVLDLVPVPQRVFPVGRLDMDTTGVLLLTNDGELAFRLAHPRYEAVKVYEARVAGAFTGEALESLNRGVSIERGLVVKGECRILERDKRTSRVEVRIHEGRKRQVKRMLKAVGFPVLELRRTEFAGLTIRGLKPGAWRDLKSREIGQLRRQVGLHTGGDRKSRS